MRKFHIEPRFQLTSAYLRNLFIEALSWFSFLKVSKSCISPSSVWMEGGGMNNLNQLVLSLLLNPVGKWSFLIYEFC